MAARIWSQPRLSMSCGRDGPPVWGERGWGKGIGRHREPGGFSMAARCMVPAALGHVLRLGRVGGRLGWTKTRWPPGMGVHRIIREMSVRRLAEPREREQCAKCLQRHDHRVGRSWTGGLVGPAPSGKERKWAGTGNESQSALDGPNRDCDRRNWATPSRARRGIFGRTSAVFNGYPAQEVYGSR